MSVNINDINRAVLATLKSGRIPFIEYDAQPLLAKALADKRRFFTYLAERHIDRRPVIVTIGTPVDEFLNPVRDVIQECIDALLPHLADGQLLVLRSTLFPALRIGSTAYLKRQGRNLSSRSVPSASFRVRASRSSATPQLISGTSPDAEEEAAELFSAIAPERIVVKPIEAEFAKLFNNAYRYIEFAATNQFYLIAKSAGLDYTGSSGDEARLSARGNIPTPGLPPVRACSRTRCSSAAFAQNEFASATPPSW